MSTTSGPIDESLYEGDDSAHQYVDIPVPEIPKEYDQRSKVGITLGRSMKAAAASYSPQARRLGSYAEAMFIASDHSQGAGNQMLQQLMSEINLVSADRMTTYRILNEFENHYLVNAIYEVLIDELLQNTGHGVTINVNCENKKELQAHAEEFMEKFQIPLVIEDLLPQLLHYGDYSFRIEDKDGEGIIDIIDDYVPGEVVALYYGLTPTAYFHFPRVRDLRIGSRSRAVRSLMDGVTALEFRKVWHLSLRGNKVKIELDQDARRQLKTPQIKVGKSIIWPAIDRLQLLRFKEVAENAKDLSRLTRPTLVGVQVPQSESGKSAAQWVSKFEKLLNSGIQDPAVQLSGSDGIISGLSKVMAGRFKAVPTFQSGRGTLEKLPIEDQLMSGDVNDKIREERELILTILGIPPELVYNTGGDTLSPHKVYARYSKKVKTIQRSITTAIKHLLVHHCSIKLNDAEISESDFDVVMTVASNMEDVDNSETLGYVIDNIKSVVEIAEMMKSAGVAGYDANGNPQSVIDPKKFMEYAKKELKAASINAVDIFVDLNMTNEEIQPPALVEDPNDRVSEGYRPPNRYVGQLAEDSKVKVMQHNRRRPGFQKRARS